MARTNVYTFDPEEGRILAGYFDRDKAEEFPEETRWDGNNNVSVHCGQWEHEILYRTARGRWVLHHWSQRQGSEPTYEFVSDDVAKRWLLMNENEGSDAAVERYFGELDEETGPGRPAIGPLVGTRFPSDVLAALDERAERDGVSRAELVRRLVTDGLAAQVAP